MLLFLQCVQIHQLKRRLKALLWQIGLNPDEMLYNLMSSQDKQKKDSTLIAESTFHLMETSLNHMRPVKIQISQHFRAHCRSFKVMSFFMKSEKCKS